jgi:putative ABC transport system permease protein
VRDDIGRRVYRLLLRLAPRSLRDKHGREMEELFARRLREARGRGLPARVAVWACAAADLAGVAARALRLGPGERATRGPAPTRRIPMTPSDVWHAVRSLLRQRLATSLVVAMLGLGIAANVAVFGLIDGLFLRPFPFPEPDRLVYVNETAPRWNLETVGINFPDFDRWRREQRVFEGLAVLDSAGFNVSGGAGAERVIGAVASHELASVLGVRPLLGRFFTPEEDRPNGPPVVVLGYGLWQERFGGARDVLGRTLRIDGVARSVVGVMPPEAEFPGRVRLWVPLAGDPNQEGQSYSGEAIGRVRSGVTVAQAEADLQRVHRAIWEERDKEKVVSPMARPLREEHVRGFRAAASALAAAVALLLVVACANVASLMLARALARRREMAIRVAVGASRLRLVVQLLIENLVLAAAGGALGLAVGYGALRALLRSLPDEAPAWVVLGLDSRVVGFSVGVTALTVVLFGWAPVLHALRGDVRSAMSNAAGAATASPRGRLTLRLLVGAEFALAALLMVSSGLLMQAFDRVRRTDPGFEPRGVLTFALSLPEAAYPDAPKRLAFWDRLLERLQALPGVDSAGGVTCPPLGCHWGSFFAAEGQPPRGAEEKDPVVLYRYATDGYFRAMGVRLRSGRLLDPRDGRPGSGRAVIVNEAFAREFFPGVADPVGRRIRRSQSSSEAPWFTVVGVVGDVKHYGLERPMRPGLYFPLAEDAAGHLTLALKTRGKPTALVGPARALLRELDPDLALYQVRTMEAALRESLATRATYSWLLAVFALLALALALGGTHGVTAYLATQRSREIGIRLALGAQRGHIRRTVLGGSLAVAGTGTAFGIVSSLGAARWLSSLLFGVPAHDLGVLGGAAGALLATAIAANWLPASRAARADPMATLRSD